MEALIQALFLTVFVFNTCMFFISLFALMPFWF